MADTGSSEGASGRSTEEYRPPSGRWKLLIAIVAVLVVTNFVTGLTAYYLAQSPAATVPLCAGGGGVRSSAAPSTSNGPSSVAAAGASPVFTFHFEPPYHTTQATITVIGPWAGAEFEGFRPVLENFTAKTGIPVTYENLRQEQLTQILPAQFASGQTPGDVIFMVSSFIKANPQHIIKETSNISDSAFIPGSLDPVKVGSDVYGGVYTGKVKPGFWYRKSFFNAHNLTAPTTYADFKALLVTISKIKGIRTPIVSGDSVGWPLSDIVEHFIATYGGASMHRALTNGTKHWTDPDVRAIFTDRLVPLLAGGCFCETPEGDTGTPPHSGARLSRPFLLGSWVTGLVGKTTHFRGFSFSPPTRAATGD